jgi:hypothetical protein
LQLRLPLFGGKPGGSGYLYTVGAWYPVHLNLSVGFSVLSPSVALRLRSGSGRSLSGIEAVPLSGVEAQSTTF